MVGQLDDENYGETKQGSSYKSRIIKCGSHNIYKVWNPPGLGLESDEEE